MRARQVRHSTVGEPLHPGLERVRALQLARGVGVQDRLGLPNRGSRLDLLRHEFLFGDDPVQLVHAPRVGLFEVDGGAQEFARGQGVAIPADGVPLGCGGQQFAAQEVHQGPVGRPGGFGARPQAFGQFGREAAAVVVGRRAQRSVGRQRCEETVLGRVPLGLLNHVVDLATGGHQPALPPGAQRGDVPVHSGRNIRQAAGDVPPLLHRVRGHQVENSPDALRRALDIIQLGQVPACRVQLQQQSQALTHRMQRDAVHVVLRGQRLQVLQRVPGRLGKGLVAWWGSSPRTRFHGRAGPAWYRSSDPAPPVCPCRHQQRRQWRSERGWVLRFQ